MVTRLEKGPGRISVRRVRSDAAAIALVGYAGTGLLLWQVIAGGLGIGFAVLPFFFSLAAAWFGTDTLRRYGIETAVWDPREKVLTARRGSGREGRLPLAEIDSLDVTRGTFQNLQAVQGTFTVVLFESFVWSPRLLKFAELLGREGVPLSPRLVFLLERRGKVRRMALVMLLFLWLSATLLWLVLRAG